MKNVTELARLLLAWIIPQQCLNIFLCTCVYFRRDRSDKIYLVRLCTLLPQVPLHFQSVLSVLLESMPMLQVFYKLRYQDA
jgi:hypothetical protein